MSHLAKVKSQHRSAGAKQRAKPGNKQKQRAYMRLYQQQPRHKAYQARYYSSSVVRAKLRRQYADDPQRVIEAREREKKEAQRQEFHRSGGCRALRNQRARTYYTKNKKRIHAKVRERRSKNPLMRLKQNLSRGIRKALQSQKTHKGSRTVELLGCKIPQFRVHLQKQFQIGMTWQNMGAWEIDHRVPVSAFNLHDPEQQKLAFNFHNLRPLWKTLNRQKSDKINGVSVRSMKHANIIQFRKVA